MRGPKIILENLQKHSKEENYKYERLYRNLYNEDFGLITSGAIPKFASCPAGVNWFKRISKFPERESQLFDVLRNGLPTLESVEA